MTHQQLHEKDQLLAVKLYLEDQLIVVTEKRKALLDSCDHKNPSGDSATRSCEGGGYCTICDRFWPEF